MCARVHKRRGAVEASLPSCKCDKCVRTCSRVPPPFTCAYKGRAMLKRQVTSEGGQLAGERWRSVCARGGRVEGLEFRARRCVSVWALHLAFVFNAGGKKKIRSEQVSERYDRSAQGLHLEIRCLQPAGRYFHSKNVMRRCYVSCKE